MANYSAYFQGSASNAWLQWSGGNNLQGDYGIGNNTIGGVLKEEGALRFVNIAVNQGVSVNAAQLRIYAQFQGTGGSIHMNTYGIKEVNTAAFTSNPFGRAATTAVTSQTNGMPGAGNFIGIDVTSQVNEIVGQGGWASGNAMGFLIKDNGSDANAYIEDDSLKGQLLIQVAAPGNFSPTPGTITIGSLPAASDWGIKVSQPGVDVKTATESQLYFTSRKKEFRVNQEATTGTATDHFAHGLSYAPSCLGYFIDSNGNVFIRNNPSSVASVEPYIASDGTAVWTFNQAGYVYVFIDPLT